MKDGTLDFAVWVCLGFGGGGVCVGREDGGNQWVAGAASNHAYLVHKMPPAELAAVIEGLLLGPPAR